MDPEAILVGLDPEQRRVAEATRGPVCVLAGAGTGKTRAITHRIAYAAATGAADPRRVLAVTFTTRAAGELRGRLHELGARAAAPGLAAVAARTFHAAAWRQLGHFWSRVVGGPPPRLIDSKLPLVTAVSRAVPGARRADPRDVAAEIEWAKVVQAGPEDYAEAAAKAGRVPPLPAPELAAVYAGYERLRRERHLLDFESLLELTAAMIDDHVEVAEAVRDRYRHFVVDEYQDVNPLQKLLLDAWLGGRDEVCVVGDPNQTIYSFSGATSAYLTGFAAEFPGAEVVRLVRDYRSTPQVVGLANRLMAAVPGARADRFELVARLPTGPEPVLIRYDDEAAEARGVAARIGELIDAGAAARDIAVLFRTNAQSAGFEQALAERGIRYAVRGAERFFERPEVRQGMALLRAAARSGPRHAGASLVDEVTAVLAGLGAAAPAPAAGAAARDRHCSIAALIQLAADLDPARHDRAAPAAAGRAEPAATVPDLAGFVAELGRREALQHAPEPDGVTLSSLHAAKGLEWDTVFVTGLAEGLVPIGYAETGEAIEEERRLLYVGVTRARRRLLLTWAAAGGPGGRAGRAPSRFLRGLLGAGSGPGAAGHPAEPGTTRRPAVPGARCRICGGPLRRAEEHKLDRCLDCPAPVDGMLLAELTSWRAAAAREGRVPAFVVFTDATLRAIAERRPADRTGLLAIPGVTASKAGRYGDDVLALCRRSVGSGPVPATIGEEVPAEDG